MNLESVRDNLKQTIKGKELLLNSLKPSRQAGYEILHHMISLNLEELNKILADIEQVIESTSECSPFNIGYDLYVNGHGISSIWGAVKCDADMDECQRGYNTAKADNESKNT